MALQVIRVINEVYHSYNKQQYPFVVLDISTDRGRSTTVSTLSSTCWCCSQSSGGTTSLPSWCYKRSSFMEFGKKICALIMLIVICRMSRFTYAPHAHTHARTHARTHACTHAHAHHTRTRTHTHTHRRVPKQLDVDQSQGSLWFLQKFLF